MRYLIPFAALSLWAGIEAQGQQRFQLSQPYQAPAIINPAATGIQPYTQVKAGFRRQWAGIPNGPTTFFGLVEGRLDFSSTTEAGSMAPPIRTRFTSGSGYVRPTAPASQAVTNKPFHAFALQVMNDQAGGFGLSAGYINYAYHIPLTSKGLFLSLGASAGVMQNRLDYSKLGFNDRILGTGTASDVNADASLGVSIHSDRVFIGYSASQLLQNKLSIVTGNALEPNLDIHHNLNAGVALPLSEEWSLIPQVNCRLTAKAPASYDGLLSASFMNKLRFGAGYRSEDAIIGNVAVILADFITAGYAYDYTLSSLSLKSSGSHEIIVGVRLNAKNKSQANRVIW